MNQSKTDKLEEEETRVDLQQKIAEIQRKLDLLQAQIEPLQKKRKERLDNLEKRINALLIT